MTWLVVSFLLRLTASAGTPVINFVSENLIRPTSPAFADLLLTPLVGGALAILTVVIILFVLGVMARRFARGRAAHLFNAAIARVPLANKIYGATRQLIQSLQQGPESGRRVVLMEFPSPGRKAIGFVTRRMSDAVTGEELAAVYIPSTPNATAGYLEIVPYSELIDTELTLDEAMTFVISGGAVGPARVHYSQSAPASPNKG